MTLKDQMIIDLDLFVNPDDFGDEAVFNSNTIDVLFFDTFESISPASIGSIETSSPQVILKTSAAAAAAHGDQIIINGTTYYITGGPQKSNDGLLSTFNLSRDPI